MLKKRDKWHDRLISTKLTTITTAKSALLLFLSPSSWKLLSRARLCKLFFVLSIKDYHLRAIYTKIRIKNWKLVRSDGRRRLPCSLHRCIGDTLQCIRRAWCSSSVGRVWHDEWWSVPALHLNAPLQALPLCALHCGLCFCFCSSIFNCSARVTTSDCQLQSLVSGLHSTPMMPPLLPILLLLVLVRVFAAVAKWAQSASLSSASTFRISVLPLLLWACFVIGRVPCSCLPVDDAQRQN